jgi:hypothetical protein
MTVVTAIPVVCIKFIRKLHEIQQDVPFFSRFERMCYGFAPGVNKVQ